MINIRTGLYSLLTVIALLFLSACGLEPEMIKISYVPPDQANIKIWAEHSLTTIKRDTTPKNAGAIVLHSAKNEWESFQIVMRSEANVHDISVVPATLRRNGGGGEIAGDLKHVYKAFQMQIGSPSPFNDNFKAGYFNDPLIPVVNPETGEPLRGGRLRGYPFDLLKDMTQSFWIDIKVPAGAASGIYTGEYQVKSGDQVVGTIAVTLNVYNVTLPETSLLRTNFNDPGTLLIGYYERQSRFFSDTEKQQMRDQGARLYRDHRLNAVPSGFHVKPVKQADGSYKIKTEDVAKLKKFIDDYNVNLLRVPIMSVNPIPWLKDIVSNPESQEAELKAWLDSWSDIRPQLGDVTLYTYIHDEAEDAQQFYETKFWGDVVKRIGKSRTKADRVNALVVGHLVYQGSDKYFSSADIWCPSFNIYKSEDVTRFRNENANNIVWSYTALTHYGTVPQWAMDFPLINYRIPTWVNVRLGIQGLLYWNTVKWDRVKDPFIDPKTFNIGGYVYNGEGSLTYPGLDVGYYGLLPSIRLKAVRDSVEDYDLLILAGSGRDAILGEIATSFKSWNCTGEQLQEKRKELLSKFGPVF